MTFISKERHSGVSAEDISERWCIGLEQARNTIVITTQTGIRSTIMPLARRYRADRVFERPLLRDQYYTDTMDGRVKSLHGNKRAQIFASKEVFAVAYPLQLKPAAGDALRQFIQDYGRPEHLTFDGGVEQCGNVGKYSIHWHVTEPHRPNQNFAEGVIPEVRKKWYRIMTKKAVPPRLWDYGLQWVCDIQNRTANTSRGLDGRCPLEKITGESVNISKYLDFGFYDWIWFKEKAGLGETRLRRWLGVSHRVGTLMSFWVLTSNGDVKSRTTAQRVTKLELQVELIKEDCAAFSAQIQERLGDHEFSVEVEDGEVHPVDAGHEREELDKAYQEEFETVVNDENLKKADEDFTPGVFDDTYLDKAVALPRAGAEAELGRVVQRMRDKNGLPIGTANDNSILDTRMYYVEFLDGHKASLAANAMARNLFAQVDDEGKQHSLFDEIVGHRTTGTEITQQDTFVTMSNGNKRRRETTQGWQIMLQWKDGSTSWVAMKVVKSAYPMQLAEYSVQARISEEPAFVWWAPWTLKKRNRVIAKIKTKYWAKTHKFGIRILSTQEARSLDVENGDTLWWDSICKKMKNIRPAFEVWEKTQGEIPIGHQETKCHLIFDIKMGENYHRKARFNAGGHTTEIPENLVTYASFVSRDSVRICLTIAALNKLSVLVCDIQNAYLTADCRERIWIRAGPEFVSEEGTIFFDKVAIIWPEVCRGSIQGITGGHTTS